MAEQETSASQALPEVLKTSAEAESFAEHLRIRQGDKVPANLDRVVVEKPEPSEPQGESAPAPEAATEEAPPEHEETKEGKQPEKPPRRDRTAEGRISELYARAKAAEDERDRLRSELATKQAPQPGAAPQPQPPQQQQQQPQQVPQVTWPAEDPPPELEQFRKPDGDYDVLAWQDLRTRWNSRQVIREAQIQQAREQIRQTLVERVQQTATKYPDFASAMNLELTPAMRDYVIGSKNGWEVAYHLSKDPESHARLLSLSPVEQVAELGVLASRYLGPQEQAKPHAAPVSRAPAPVRPISGTAPPPAKSTADALTFEEHMALRKAQLKVRG